MPALKPLVVPAILAKSAAEFQRKLRAVEKDVPMVQVDVMDGKFVPNKTWCNAKTVARMKSKTSFELHLMVNDPFAIIRDWLSVPGFRRVVLHVESPVPMAQTIRAAHTAGIEVGLAISPGTPLSKLTKHLSDIELVVVMGGTPGFSGHPFDPKRLAVVRAIRKKSRHIPIGMDIGVSRETIPTLVRAGVTVLYTASAIFKAKNPRAELKALQQIATRTAK